MAIKPPGNLVRKPPAFETFFQSLRSLNKFHFIQACGILLIIALGWLILRSEVLLRFEYLFLDLMIRNKPAIQASPDIVFIEIAEDTLQVIRERPLPRNYHGIIAEILKTWGAKAILFDYVFEGKTTPFNDDVFEESLKKNAGNIYFPVVAEKSGKKQSLLRSIPEFENHAHGLGHINISTDEDGILRRFQPFIKVNGNYYPHIGLKIAYDLLDKKIASPRDLRFNTDETGSVFIDWAGKWAGTFQHFSYLDLLKSFEQIQSGQKPTIPPSAFKDKICLIGHTAAGGTDIKATPLDNAYPGLGVIGNILNAGLHGQFAKQATLKQNLTFLIALGLLASLFLIPFKNLLSLLSILILIAVWIGLAYFLFLKNGIWFYLFQPILSILILFIFSALFSKMVNDRERIRFYELSTTDSLTGTFVRRYFDVRAKHEFEKAQRSKTPLSLILFDIDHFKNINDIFGHQAGDEVLRKISKLILTYIRYQARQKNGSTDLLARYGGEEFVLLLPNTDLKIAAFNVAERIRSKIELTPIFWEGQTISITVCAGVSSAHDFDKSIDVLIARADEALYRSKAEGRNRTSVESF